MSQRYGYILTSDQRGCTRAVLLDDDRVCVEHLTVENTVTLSLEELDALSALVSPPELGHRALERLLNDDGFRVRLDDEDDPNPLFDL